MAVGVAAMAPGKSSTVMTTLRGNRSPLAISLPSLLIETIAPVAPNKWTDKQHLDSLLALLHGSVWLLSLRFLNTPSPARALVGARLGASRAGKRLDSYPQPYLICATDSGCKSTGAVEDGTFRDPAVLSKLEAPRKC